MGRSVDYLIVGQGLAGSLLGWELIHRGARICIVDTQTEHAAYPVAAGILNPVTGKRIVKSWNVDAYLPLARDTYQTLEKAFGQPYFTPQQLIRIFQDPEEIQLWEERKADPEYADWLGDRFECGHFGEHQEDPFGSFEIHQAGWLAVADLVEQLRRHFLSRDMLVDSKFAYGDLELANGDTGLRWNGVSAQKVIFCEGYKGAENPWFAWLDFRLSKGEVLDIKTDYALPDYIINRGKWVLPTGPYSARVGATYGWSGLESGPSITGMAEIMKALRSLSGSRYPVTGHRAGIRPGTNDSKPYLGLHPLDSRLGILNGLGSKGSLLGPAMAHALSNFLVNGEALDEEIRIDRRLRFLDAPLELP